MLLLKLLIQIIYGHAVFLWQQVMFKTECVSGCTSGTFGQVLECWDRERKEMVAIKIIRAIKNYRDAAMIEIGMLEQLGKYDKSRSR
jgi:dual-specificity kinase